MNGERRRPGTYATRYGLIATVISILFVTAYTALEMMEPHIRPTFSQFLASAGLEYWLVLTMPLTLTPLAYWAGRQRDRVAAYAHDRDTLNHILHTLLITPDPDLDQTLPQVLRHIAAAQGFDDAVVLVRQYDAWIIRAATRDAPDTAADIAQQLTWPPTTPMP